MLDELYGRIADFYEGEPLVFGEGTENAAVLLIGEAPGRDEVRERRPFRGKAGKNLDDFLAAAGVERRGLYITNVCKFRPRKVSAKGSVSNRPPTKEEIAAALPFLYEEIRAVNPGLIVTLGNTPLRACFCDFTKTIGAMHGERTEVCLADRKYGLFPLYHPASVIYNQSLRAVYADDLARLKRVLTAP